MTGPQAVMLTGSFRIEFHVLPPSCDSLMSNVKLPAAGGCDRNA